MTKDPVCGMMISEKDAVASTTYEGKQYHFCSKVCHTKFMANPEQYAGKA